MRRPAWGETAGNCIFAADGHKLNHEERDFVGTDLTRRREGAERNDPQITPITNIFHDEECEGHEVIVGLLGA